MSNSFRDRERHSDRFKDKSGEEILQSMRDEFDQGNRTFFDPQWTEPSTLSSHFTRGFPFDTERKPRGSRLQKHLDELAARHPEFAQHLRPEMAFANKSEQRRRQPSGSSSGVFSSGDEDAVSDTHSQANEEMPKQPQQETPRKLPQYGLRNTVDLGGAAQKLEQSERNQRSWSAPPEGRTFEDHPKRFVSRIEIQPQLSTLPTKEEEGTAPMAASEPAPTQATSSSGTKPPMAPKPPPRSGERVIPIFVEGRNEPVVPKMKPGGGGGGNTNAEQPPPPPPPRHEEAFEEPFQDRGFDDFADFPSFGGRSFGFSRPHGRQQRSFGEPFWSQSQYTPQQPPPAPPQKRPMSAQPPPNKRPTDKPQPAPAEQPPTCEKPPPPPPIKDPLAKVAAVQKDVEELMKEVELYSGNSKDKQYLFLDEMLTRELIKLDDIDTDGKDNIRQARKEAIRSIQRAIGLLESKVQKTESKAVAETDAGQSSSSEAMEVEPDASQSQESK